MGIRVLDTAEAYGNALEIIGLFHAKNPDKKFNIINKISPLYSLEENTLKEHVLKQMELMN
ncbi:uncharacterized protein METZ01_LOCUS246725, partial [marine metagenome]